MMQMSSLAQMMIAMKIRFKAMYAHADNALSPVCSMTSISLCVTYIFFTSMMIFVLIQCNKYFFEGQQDTFMIVQHTILQTLVEAMVKRVQQSPTEIQRQEKSQSTSSFFNS